MGAGVRAVRLRGAPLAAPLDPAPDPCAAAQGATRAHTPHPAPAHPADALSFPSAAPHTQLRLISPYRHPPPQPEPQPLPAAAAGDEAPAPKAAWFGPLRALASRREVWAICIAQFCGSWGLYGLISWLPTYFSDQFGVSMADLPAFTFLPYIIQGGVGLGVGALADKLLERGWSRLLVRRVLQVAGMVAPAVALLAAVSLAGEKSVQTAAILVVRPNISALLLPPAAVQRSAAHRSECARPLTSLPGDFPRRSACRTLAWA